MKDGDKGRKMVTAHESGTEKLKELLGEQPRRRTGPQSPVSLDHVRTCVPGCFSAETGKIGRGDEPVKGDARSPAEALPGLRFLSPSNGALSWSAIGPSC